jgi:integrase
LSIIRRAFSLASRTHPPKVRHIPPVEKLPEDNIRTGFIEDEQYRALEEHITRARTPLVIGYHLGLRRGAILLLEWSMVDMQNEELRLPPRLAKNKTGQVCPLYGRLLEHMKELRANTPKSCKWVCHDNGERIREFKGEWASAVKAAGLSGLLFHDLRRSAVRNMVRAGVPEIVARAISGHKTRSIFDRYNITSGADLKRAGKLLERAQNGHNEPPDDPEK